MLRLLSVGFCPPAIATPISRTTASALGCRIFTTVSAEADEEGDSSDAREYRSRYFMILGI